MASPATGLRLGPYELLSPIGSGGMGEVWKARDTRLNRIVAVKLVQPGFADRFAREARAIAALNHPNICQIHDVGENYFVMEFIDGEPVRAVENTRKLLDVAVQIASAMARAHEAGFVHRDLKPENILVSREGRVKLLDFGLAKQAVPDQTSVTQTLRITNPGTVVGTALYMSPEQARGLDVDARSDQFAFGLILYELISGKRPFVRDSAAETMAAIIRDDAAPLAADVPAPLRWVVERCLAKEPSGRYQSTHDLYLELAALRDRITELSSASVAAEVPKRRRWPVWLGVASSLLMAGTIGYFTKSQRPIPELHFVPFVATDCSEAMPAWSPDGKTIAYSCLADGVPQIFTKPVDGFTSAQITNGSAPSGAPFWSADGSRLYFSQGTSLYYVGAAGGAPQLFLKDAYNAAFSSDGKSLAYVRRSDRSLMLANADGSNAVEYRRGEYPKQTRNVFVAYPSKSGPLAALTTVFSGDRLRRELWIIRSKDQDARRVPLPKDFVLFGRGISWMPDGTHLVVVSPGTIDRQTHLMMLNSHTGAVAPLTSGILSETDAAVSPDGKRIAFVTGRLELDVAEVEIGAGQIRTKIKTSLSDFAPEWSPGGREFAYTSGAAGTGQVLWVQTEGGPARPVPLGDAGSRVAGMTFSPDGQRIAFDTFGLQQHRIMVAPAVGGVPVVLDPSTSDNHRPSFSPDGNWIAFRRDLKGEIYLSKIPSGGGSQAVDLIKIGSGGPDFPVQWSPTGEWIAYGGQSREIHLVAPDGKQSKLLSKADYPGWSFDRAGKRIIAFRRAERRVWTLFSVDVATGIETPLRALDVPIDTEIRGLSLHPDGQRFLTTTTIGQADIWQVEGFAQPEKPWWAFWQ